MGHDDAVLLEPNHGHYDGLLIRRQYEGSSVEIGPARIAWTPPSYRWYRHGRFAVPIGEEPGQAHAVTKVRTAFPVRASPGIIERYIVTDTTRAVLGSFPSGEGISGSSLPEHQAGWYPAPAVQKAVQAAGLVWDDRDFVGDAPALDKEFHGAVPHVRGLHRMWWVQSASYVIGGCVFAGMATGSAVSDGSSLGFSLMFYGLGLGFVVAGIFVSPPVMRRVRKRNLARSHAA
jgi:hypothetical protein